MKEGVVTFGEKAGVAGPAFFIPMVASKIEVALVNSSGKFDLPLSAHNVSGGGGELTIGIDSAPPFSLNLACNFGIFAEDPSKPASLLKYHSSADVVTTPNDWFTVQDWNTQKGLEVTIRDPYMKQSVEAHELRSALPGDQCKAHQGPTQDGQACVIAVVRFNGQLFSTNVSLTTYTADGSKLSHTFASGVVILKVPLNSSLPFTEVFAAVNYREPTSGVHDGKNYSTVDHWATTYARISRPAVVLV